MGTSKHSFMLKEFHGIDAKWLRPPGESQDGSRSLAQLKTFGVFTDEQMTVNSHFRPDVGIPVWMQVRFLISILA